MLLAWLDYALLWKFNGETLSERVFHSGLVVAVSGERARLAQNADDGGLGVGEFVKHGLRNYFNFIYLQCITLAVLAQ